MEEELAPTAGPSLRSLDKVLNCLLLLFEVFLETPGSALNFDGVKAD